MAETMLKYSATIALEAPGTSPFIFRGDLCSNIAKCKKYGFTAVELHIRHPYKINAEEIRKCCSENGIAVSTIGTGMSYVMDGLCLTEVDAHKRKNAMERLKEYVGLAEHLGCGIIIGSMRGKVIPGCFEKQLAVYGESLLELSFYSRQRNVPVYLEAINRYEVNFHNTVEEMVNYLDDLFGREANGGGTDGRGTDNGLKILIDTFHMNIEEADIGDVIRKYGRYIGHVHFADSNRRYPGAGHIDFGMVINALKDIGYGGYIAFEYLPYPDPDTAALKGLDNIRSING